MIELVRKDMPLRGNITTFECVLNDPIMDRELIKTIPILGTSPQIREQLYEALDVPTDFGKTKGLNVGVL